MVRGDFRSQGPGDPAVNLDPARDHTRSGMELLRCCLARTLLAPDDRPGHGGALVPDLAVAMPKISADGLLWTFRLKPGLHYAPPYQDTPIVAEDIQRALIRVATLGSDAGYAYEYSPIQGFDDVVAGTASTITGLSVPNDRTLVIRLVSPTADLGDRLALPAAAPLPPGPKQGAAMGVATGHDHDYGAFLVSSGPYMLNGSNRNPSSSTPLLDLTQPSDITLIRNPSWNPADDPLRPAYVGQIRISTGADQPSDNAALVAGDALDFQFEERSTASQSAFTASQENPSAQRVFSWPLDDTWVIAMNVAVPPFDDPHIRKAVGLAFNEQGALEAIRRSNASSTGWHTTGLPLVHVVPDALEAGRLSGFDPFLGKKGPERRSRAIDSIGKSKYEHKRDGDCIDLACKNISIAVSEQAPFPDIADSLRLDLKAVGIVLQPVDLPFAAAFDQRNHVGIVIGPPNSTDVPEASRSFLPLLGAMITSDVARNFSLVGASSAELEGFGYATTDVPTIDGSSDLCRPLTATEQLGCWTLLDKDVMTTMFPWVPYFTSTLVWETSSRVRGVAQDPFSKMPALDQVWLSRVTATPSP